MTQTFDPDYILATKEPMLPRGAAVRRAVALQQWLRAKGDADFAQSLETIEKTTEREAWRVFRQRNGRSLVRTFRVRPGEPICDSRLGLNINREQLAQGQELGHALITSLATVDVDEVVTSLQPSLLKPKKMNNSLQTPNDPLSWHCPKHPQQHPAAWTRFLVLPCPRRDPSPPREPPFLADADCVSEGPMVPILVTFDTLEWPTRRTIKLPPRETGKRQSRSHQGVF